MARRIDGPGRDPGTPPELTEHRTAPIHVSSRDGNPVRGAGPTSAAGRSSASAVTSAVAGLDRQLGYPGIMRAGLAPVTTTCRCEFPAGDQSVEQGTSKWPGPPAATDPPNSTPGDEIPQWGDVRAECSAASRGQGDPGGAVPGADALAAVDVADGASTPDPLQHWPTTARIASTASIAADSPGPVSPAWPGRSVRSHRRRGPLRGGVGPGGSAVRHRVPLTGRGPTPAPLPHLRRTLPQGDHTAVGGRSPALVSTRSVTAPRNRRSSTRKSAGGQIAYPVSTP